MVKTPLEELITNAPSEAIDLLEMMFTYDPNNRPTATQCLDHDFFAGFDAPVHIKAKNSISNPKPIVNKTNKLISSKLMRMNSKKFEHERHERHERQKSPYLSKTSENEKDSSGRQLVYSKLNKFPPVKSEIGSGFYIKNKPIKSPGTPTSSTNSHALYKGNKFSSK